MGPRAHRHRVSEDGVHPRIARATRTTSTAAAYGLVLVALAGRMLNDLYSVEIAVAGVLFLSLDADLALVRLRLAARIVGLLSRRRDPREVSPGT